MHVHLKTTKQNLFTGRRKGLSSPDLDSMYHAMQAQIASCLNEVLATCNSVALLVYSWHTSSAELVLSNSLIGRKQNLMSRL